MKLIRRFWNDCRVFTRSPLCRHVTIAVFLGIVVIEAIILLPSYWSREAEFLDRLEHEGIQAAVVSLAAPATPHAGLTSALAAPHVAGIATLSPSGHVLDAVGESIGLAGSGLAGSDGRRLRSSDGGRYEIVLPATKAGLPVGLALRMDSSWVAPELMAFTIRIAGLVLLISVFVNVVTMVLVGKRLIIPMIRLREGL